MTNLNQKELLTLQQFEFFLRLESHDAAYLVEIENQLWTLFGTRLDLKTVEQIKKNPDSLDRALSLLDEIRKVISLEEHADWRAAVAENLRLLEEKRQKEQEKEASARLASHPKAPQIIAQLKQITLSQNLPEVTAYELVLSPQTALAALPPNQAALFVTTVASFDPPTAILVSQVSEITPALAPLFVPYVYTNPTPAQISNFITTAIQPKIEAQGISTPANLSSRLVQMVASLHVQPTPEEAITQSISSQLIQKSVSPSIAQEISVQASTFTRLNDTLAKDYTPIQDRPTTRLHLYNATLAYVTSLNRQYLTVNQLLSQTNYQAISWLPPQFLSSYDSISYSSVPPQQQAGQAQYLQFIGQFFQDKIQDKIVSSAVKKLTGSLGTKAATTAAVEAGTAVAVGAEVAAGPPGWVLAAATVLATFGKDIISWGKRVLKEYVFPLLGALLGLGVAAITGIVALPLGALGGGLAGWGIKSSGGITGALTKAGNAITAGSTAMVGLVATEIATPIIVIGLSIPIVIALILFIINSSALVVPPNPYGLSNNQSSLNFIPPGETVECTTADKPLSFKYDTNPTASAAWSIVNNLKQGFWCYWNNSPDYPELFDQAEYQKYPYHCVYEPNNPLNCSGDYRSLGGYSLFWCTWLIRKVYPTTYPFTNLELGANNMKENWFKSPGKYLPNASGVVQKISPGDTIFLRTGHNSDDYAGHAALVYLVTQDFVFTLDSNASAKTHSYTVSTDGSIQGLSGLTVLGFGKLN